MATEQRSLEVAGPDRVERITWYVGGGHAGIERAIRASFDLSESEPVLLRDDTGSIVALSDQIPDGLRLRLDPPHSSEPTAQPVPGPMPYPALGNLPQIAAGDDFTEQAIRLSEQYGPFYRLHLPGTPILYMCSDPDVVAELVARQQDFAKLVTGRRNPLANLRDLTVGQGLFTASDDDELWQVAHRILLPSLGAQALRQYFPAMVEVTDDLLAVLGESTEPVLATELMTRATFDTIAATGFGARFGAVRASEAPPFLAAMVDVLTDAMSVTSALIPRAMRPGARRRRERADAVMRETVDAIIASRRASLERGVPVPNDLLQAMLTGRDRATGQVLPDENIRHQLLTFLIAGHETTAGALSYALYYLATHPAAEERLLAEVDDILGLDYSVVPQVRDVERMSYTGRAIMEALRLNPTAPAFSRVATRDTLVAGRYAIARGEKIIVLLPALHRNTQVWGENAKQFEPDRFLPGAMERRHPHAYHPFGLGMRSCIGFQFALLEARLILGRIYQRFRPRLADPRYVLAHLSTLTTKPADLWLRFEPRSEDRGRRPLREREASSAPRRTRKLKEGGLAVWYGSNMGAAQQLAGEIARRARERGWKVDLAELDDRVGQRPEILIAVCSTYNGHPPDNARLFIDSLDHATLDGLRFAVLGLGNQHWRTTYQSFPRAMGDALARAGGTPVLERGECDVADDFDGVFESWCARLWPTLGVQPNKPEPTHDPPRYAVEVVNFAGAADLASLPCACPVHIGSRLTSVLVNDELHTPASSRSARHLEVALPEGTPYEAGDHLGVFPVNPPEIVEAIAHRIGSRPREVVVLRERSEVDGAHVASLPTGVPVIVSDLLAHRLDLLGPVSRRELALLASRSPCPPDRRSLEHMASAEGYPEQVLAPKLTILEVLHRFPSVQCDLALLLSLRPALKPRFYSIASSPRLSPTACAVTVGLHTFATSDGLGRDGLCSTYLARQEPGQGVRIVVRDTGSRFRLPDPERDLLLIGAGTGIAPLRGFLQERDALRREGTRIGRAWLFFGCRSPELDYLYREELEDHVRLGTLTGLYPAFSRHDGQAKTYVQHLLHEHAQTVWTAIADGATVMVCGDARRMAPDVMKAFTNLFRGAGGLESEEAGARLEAMQREGQYLQDVWAS